MIDFIIIEDSYFYLNKYKRTIDKVMMNYDINYQINIYDKYSNRINTYVKKDSFKIYLVNFKEEKNIDMIKAIREKHSDWQSLIVIIYSEEDKIEMLRKENLYILGYIHKNDNMDHSLFRNIQICLKVYDNRPNSLKYCYKKIMYNIDYHKILYIEKEQDNKRCLIKTKEKEYYIQGSLRNIEKQLDKRFIKCNRSYIINMEQVEQYNIKDNIIMFKDKTKLNTISRDKRKIIINYLRGIYIL